VAGFRNAARSRLAASGAVLSQSPNGGKFFERRVVATLPARGGEPDASATGEGIAAVARQGPSRRRPTPARQPPDAGRPEGAPDRHSPSGQGPVSLLGVVGHFIHGLAFLLLAGAAASYFGRIFWVVSAVMAALSLVSLREGWNANRRYREARKT
jgi:hypothetical protein